MRYSSYGGDPEIYRMTVHLFGGVWRPSCAGFALKWTFSEHGKEMPEDITRNEQNFYATIYFSKWIPWQEL